MEIKSFTFDPDLLGRFGQLSFDLYRDDPQWIPPLGKTLFHYFSPTSPFLREPGSDYRNFVALQGGRVVGRISAFINPQLRDSDGRPVGTVGLFECVRDYSVARDLLDASTRWLKEEYSRGIVWGPMNYDIWHGYRLMTNGFNCKIFCGEPYNKPYYPRFFERFGFITKQTWDSVDIADRASREKVMRRGAERWNQVSQRGYRFLPFDMRNFEQEVRNLYDLLTQSFASFLGYTTTSFAEYRRIFDSYRSALDPALFLFARDENDRLAGFVGSFLDVSDGVRVMRGNDTMLARLRFLLHKHSHRIVLYLAGVTPEEATRKSGLGRAAFYYILRQAGLRGYDQVVVALMAKGNIVHGVLNGLTAQRQYALYELKFGST